jgi:DNA invertase Pin-like site-specific DNA recombinase
MIPMLAYDLRYNYCALALAVIKRNYTIDTAINYFSPNVQPAATKDEAADMLSMRQSGMTYREIGDVFGVNKSAVYNRIRRLQGRI